MSDNDTVTTLFCDSPWWFWTATEHVFDGEFIKTRSQKSDKPRRHDIHYGYKLCKHCGAKVSYQQHVPVKWEYITTSYDRWLTSISGLIKELEEDGHTVITVLESSKQIVYKSIKPMV